MNFPSKILEDAVNAVATLPGVGKKSALRMVLHLTKNGTKSLNIAQALTALSNNLVYCKTCYSIADTPTCSICANASRNNKTLCVVEHIRDLMAIEDTNQYHGMYFILGGLISPLDGIGPSDINIDALVERIKSGEVSELIMAISPSIEGDTTLFYITKLLKEYPVNITTLARGISFGGELEYADEFTLGRSIISRVPYKTDV